MDPDSGAQPLFSEDGSICLAVNGEIYNYKALQEGLSKPFDFKTKSDCEVIIPLYEEHGDDMVKMLDGMYVNDLMMLILVLIPTMTPASCYTLLYAR